MSIQKYQINDRVKRPNKNIEFYILQKRRELLQEKEIADCRYGTIIEAKLVKDSRSRFHYRYYVKWDGYESLSLHSQNTLKPVEDN